MNALWQRWSPRERALVGIAVMVCTFVFLSMFGGNGESDGPGLKRRVASQKADLQWLKQAAVQRRALTGSSQPGQLNNASIVVVIDTSTRQHKLAQYLQQNQSPDQNTARVSFKDAPFDDVVRWLATLEQNHNVRAESANINLSDAAGLVDARFSLR
ncbi:MAG: type II secretion system protein M, partial [Gammaproteobacteria bacterium]|nr:type II secretion system protein M [Gammaproteobacteria bacterium]